MNATESGSRTRQLASLLETLNAVSEIAARETLQLQTLRIFLVIAMRGELSQVELNKMAAVSEASVSRNIRMLGRGRPDAPGYGWVESYRDPADYRFTRVRLTREGAQVAKQLAEHLGSRQ